jgi:phospholipase D1/2
MSAARIVRKLVSVQIPRSARSAGASGIDARPAPAARGTPRAVSAPAAGLLRPGRNCWRVERADRFRCIQDADDYFRWVRQALLAARHSIFIVGWDLQAMDLAEPGRDGSPTRLDAILAHVARRRRGLRCHVLIWGYDALYTLERDPLLRWRLGWRTPRHVRFGFDDRHPLAACHHQKIIVVDDAIAFCGSIDLTTHRWDTPRHAVDDPRRKTLAGEAYGPYHEVAAMVSGPAAARLGELARERWRTSQNGGRLPPPRAGGRDGSPDGGGAEELWPADAEPDLSGVGVAIARTQPEFCGQPAARECETLLLDAIGAAQRSLYIESQYFTSDTLAQALAARLAEPAGPEVVVVVPREFHGWLERNTMGVFREEVFRRMAAADRHGRLRLVYPMGSRGRGIPTFIHSKVLVADDTVLRIGSANFARRSMAMDTECDLAIDGASDSVVREGIRRIRDRLLGEHLGLAGEAVAACVAEAGSLRAFVDGRGGADRALVRIDPATLGESSVPEAVRAAADPDGPVAIETVLEERATAFDPAATRRGRAAARLRGTAAALLAAPSLVPVELMALVCGLLLGASPGLVVAFAGALVAASLGYAAGRLLGVHRLARFMTRRAWRSLRQVGAGGVRGVAALRLSSVANSGAVQVFCGARGVRFAPYFLGSVLALLPQVVAVGGLGALLRQTVQQPSPGRRLATLAAILSLLAGAAVLRSILLRRRFGPAVAEHRRRAEFG